MPEFEVQRVEAEFPGDEQWERVPYDDFFWVGVNKDGEDHTFQVTFAMCQVPLDGELRSDVHQRIESVLGAVPGVESVDMEDQEVWVVVGDSASGEQLMEAAGSVADALADRVRTYRGTN